MLHLVRKPATDQEIKEMLEVHESYIKVAVDIRREILVGGGEFHADCEAVLLDDGSRREDVWGADWIPANATVRCAALINIRPRVNPTMEIHDPTTQRQVEAIIQQLFQRS